MEPRKTPTETPDQTRRSEARELLRRYWIALFVQEQRDHFGYFERFVGAPDSRGVPEAAREVLADVQAELAQFHRRSPSEPLEWAVARRLARDRFHAVTALLDLMISKEAKQVQLEITGGLPLAICMGEWLRIGKRREPKMVRIVNVEDELRFTPKGCLRIFDDATNTVGEMWPGYCSDCNNTRRQPVRDQRRALARRIHAAMRSPSVYEYKLIIPPPRAGTE